VTSVSEYRAVTIPVMGRIAAGTPIEALQGTDTLPVPAALLGPGEHYALEVAGDSMVEEGILDGDYALIRRQETARDGEIVVALINNEEATLKTYRREGQMIRLDPANRQYDPQRYREDQIQIQGKLAGLLRRY
jgi:repressor LexA